MEQEKKEIIKEMNKNSEEEQLETIENSETKKNMDSEVNQEENIEIEEDLGDYSYEVKIPVERVPVLIGKDGETKKLIEEQTNCKLDISKDGDVNINGTDGLDLFTTKDIIKAIGRGFNPRIALLLLKSDYSFEIIDMKDVAGKSKNTMLRLKGRVIGKGGKSREEIERLTNSHISVYGKTVGIIGEITDATLARQAVAMLLKGSMHKTVFRFLEKRKREQLFG